MNQIKALFTISLLFNLPSSLMCMEMEPKKVCETKMKPETVREALQYYRGICKIAQKVTNNPDIENIIKEAQEIILQFLKNDSSGKNKTVLFEFFDNVDFDNPFLKDLVRQYMSIIETYDNSIHLAPQGAGTSLSSQTITTTNGTELSSEETLQQSTAGVFVREQQSPKEGGTDLGD